LFIITCILYVLCIRYEILLLAVSYVISLIISFVEFINLLCVKELALNVIRNRTNKLGKSFKLYKKA